MSETTNNNNETKTKTMTNNKTNQTTEARAIYLELVTIQLELAALRNKKIAAGIMIDSDSLNNTNEDWDNYRAEVKTITQKITGRKGAWKNRVRKIRFLDGKFDRDFFKFLGGDKS